MNGHKLPLALSIVHISADQALDEICAELHRLTLPNECDPRAQIAHITDRRFKGGPIIGPYLFPATVAKEIVEYHRTS